MLYQGIIGGGSSPVEPEDLSPVLLWTNPNPNDAFAQTSLTLDLSNYTAILVEYGSRVKNQSDCVISGWYCKVIDLPNTNSTNTNVIGTDNSSTVSGRRIWYEPSSKSLTIGANYGANESNNQAIPFNIYGVKEYVVEPVGTQIGVYAYGNNPSEQYANCVIENCKFKKLKVVSYENLASSVSEYPKIIINDVTNNRPAVGTVFDVYDKKVSITSWAGAAAYAKVGIVVEFI